MGCQCLSYWILSADSQSWQFLLLVCLLQASYFSVVSISPVVRAYVPNPYEHSEFASYPKTGWQILHLKYVFGFPAMYKLQKVSGWPTSGWNEGTYLNEAEPDHKIILYVS